MTMEDTCSVGLIEPANAQHAAHQPVIFLGTHTLFLDNTKAYVNEWLSVKGLFSL